MRREPPGVADILAIRKNPDLAAVVGFAAIGLLVTIGLIFFGAPAFAGDSAGKPPTAQPVIVAATAPGAALRQGNPSRRVPDAKAL